MLSDLYIYKNLQPYTYKTNYFTCKKIKSSSILEDSSCFIYTKDSFYTCDGSYFCHTIEGFSFATTEKEVNRYFNFYTIRNLLTSKNYKNLKKALYDIQIRYERFDLIKNIHGKDKYKNLFYIKTQKITNPHSREAVLLRKKINFSSKYSKYEKIQLINKINTNLEQNIPIYIVKMELDLIYQEATKPKPHFELFIIVAQPDKNFTVLGQLK